MYKEAQAQIHGIFLPYLYHQLINGHFANDSFLIIKKDRHLFSIFLKCLNIFLLLLVPIFSEEIPHITNSYMNVSLSG